MTLYKKNLHFLWLSLFIVFLDLGSKCFITRHFALFESINVFPFFNITYVRNYGAAFSFLAHHAGWQTYFFIMLAVAATVVLIVFLLKNASTQYLQNTAYAFIIGGAIGNAVDRMYHGFVVDFFDFYWQQWHYPVFNIADIAICLGVAFLILDTLKNTKNISNDKK